MCLRIEFSNPEAVYSPGNVVSGTAEIDLHTNIKISLVTISLEGKASSEWISNSRGNGSKAGASLIYATADFVVWKAKENEEDGMKKGLHRFPFRFLLPNECPPSFEGMNGYIRYQIRVEMDKKWIFPSNNKKPFTVVPPVDLNMNPKAFQPIFMEKMEKIGGIFSKKGKIQMNISVPKSGFVPGEEIPVTMEINNESSLPVTKAKVKLVQKVHLKGVSEVIYTPFLLGMDVGAHLNEETKEERKVTKKTEIVHVDGNSKGILNLSLMVPSTVQSFDSCPIIKVEYFLKVKVKTNSALSPSVKAEFPVLIGTVPLLSSSSVAPPLHDKCEEPPSYSEVLQDVNGNKFSFKESVFGKYGTTKDMTYTEEFAPRYPYFENLRRNE